MKLKAYKKLVAELGVEKAKLVVDGEEIVDEAGEAVDVEVVELSVKEEVVEESADDAVKTAAREIAKAIRSEVTVTADHTNKFRSLGKRIGDVIKSGKPGSFTYNQKLTNFNDEDSDADGGYLLEVAKSKPVWDLFSSEVLARIDKVAVAQQALNLISIPFAATKAVVEATQGGVIADSKLVYDSDAILLKTYASLVNVTNELIQDDPSIGGQIESILMRDLSRTLEAVVMTKVTAAACAVDVERAVANQIAEADILNMFSKLWVGTDLSRCAWIYNPSCVPQLLAHRDSTAGIQHGPINTLLGIPMIPSCFAAALGTAADLQLVDMSNVALGVKSSGPEMATSAEFLFDYNITGARMTCRAAAGIRNDNTMTENSVVYSSIVALADPAA